MESRGEENRRWPEYTLSIFYEPSHSLLSLDPSPSVPNISLVSREVDEEDGTKDMWLAGNPTYPGSGGTTHMHALGGWLKNSL